VTGGLILAALLTANAPGTPSQDCLGVAIQSQYGPVNLMGISVAGPETALANVTAAAIAIGVRPGEIQRDVQGRATIAFVSPRIRSADAIQLVIRTRSGEFGALELETRTMGIETLPPDRCPRT
jgi:hypothetical protein